MQLLKTFNHLLENTQYNNLLLRPSVRAIVVKNEQILLLHTKRYHDFSLPGGGIDEGETPHCALVRELFEETGATGISNIRDYGKIEELRPWYKAPYDHISITSYCYMCDVDALGEQQLEEYEKQNGMTVEWVDINHAIAHNQHTLAHSEKAGLSIIRETFLLQHIKQTLNL
jgi:8-oxo-dGTP pyrophosphatase MutT (NUDIX family)